MPKFSISKALKAKKKSLNLSDAKLAKAIGISVVALQGVLSGKRDPNARTAGKYAKFLKIKLPQGEAAKPTTKRGPGRPKGSRKIIVALPKAIKALTKDQLAIAIHEAPKKLRKIVAVLLRV